MENKIIVAGSGHGGLTAAALLADKGYSVTVYEKQKYKDLGHDWTDVFDIVCFDEVGIPRPPKKNYTRSHSITYTNPNKTMFVRMPENEVTTNSIMDRKYLIHYLVNFAKSKGVKFKFGVEIVAPIVTKDRVIGITIKKNDKYDSVFADMVIDAAGINSPIRSLLPERFGIKTEMGKKRIFTAYRAFFNKLPGDEPENQYTVHFYHMREPGLDWVISEKDYMDVLIGRFSDSISVEQIDDAIADLRESYPTLGEEIKRGGQIVRIPIRRTLPMIVADGYAVTGDAAAMTIPIIGSGIANSIRAGKYLADAITESKENDFSIKTLWKYQYNYFMNVGNKLIIVDRLRDLAVSLSPDDVDYLLEKEILSANEFSLSKAKITDISISELFAKIVRALPKLPVLAGAARTFAKLGSIRKIANSIPEEYDEDAVKEWAKKYEDL